MTSNEFDSLKTPDTTVFRRWFFMCAWHDAQAGVPGESWDILVRRYRTEGRRQQGKGMTRDGKSEGSMRQNPCT